MASKDGLNPKSRHNVTIDGTNLWSMWNLVADPPVTVVPPPPQFNYVEVPGRDGPLDFTEALDNKIHYNNREGEWTFTHAYMIDTRNFYDIVAEMQTLIYGQNCIIKPDDGGIFRGRCWISGVEWNDDGGKVTVSYNLEPNQIVEESTEGGG